MDREGLKTSGGESLAGADPLTCDIEQLADLKPVLTMVDGRIVHDSITAV